VGRPALLLRCRYGWAVRWEAGAWGSGSVCVSEERLVGAALLKAALLPALISLLPPFLGSDHPE
jgi:hypothetical protein